MTRGVSRFQYMRTQRNTKTTKHTGGNLSERVFCKTVKFQKPVTRLGEFCLNSKIDNEFPFLAHVHLDEEEGKWARSWTSAVTMLA